MAKIGLRTTNLVAVPLGVLGVLGIAPARAVAESLLQGATAPFLNSDHDAMVLAGVRHIG